MLKKFFLVFMCLSLHMGAEIYEINEIDRVRDYIQSENDLIFFDIDDTLISNPHSLGTTAWRGWAKPKLTQKEPFSVYDALCLFFAKQIPYRSVEESTAKLICDLQQQGNPVFGFTARGRSEWYSSKVENVDKFTHAQLNLVGIFFDKSQVPEGFDNIDPQYHFKGILFSKHMKKGDLLKKILTNCDFKPPRILFIDDSFEHIQSVENALKEMGIPYIGFWYRHMEQRGKDFEPNIANIQMEKLLFENQYVDDEEAKEIMLNRPSIDPKDYLDQILQNLDIEKIHPTLSEYKHD